MLIWAKSSVAGLILPHYAAKLFTLATSVRAFLKEVNYDA